MVRGLKTTPHNQTLQTDEPARGRLGNAAQTGLRPEGGSCGLAAVAVLSANLSSADSPLSVDPLYRLMNDSKGLELRTPNLGGRRGVLSDWITQRWVQLTGKGVNLSDCPWLEGPVGDVELIGSAFFRRLAEKKNLEFVEDGPGRGLIADFSRLGARHLTRTTWMLGLSRSTRKPPISSSTSGRSGVERSGRLEALLPPSSADVSSSSMFRCHPLTRSWESQAMWCNSRSGRPGRLHGVGAICVATKRTLMRAAIRFVTFPGTPDPA